jgi:hypothetical protein
MVAIGGVISHVRHVPIYYDPNTLSLVVWDGTVTGGGSGGGAVTIANGADVVEGALGTRRSRATTPAARARNCAA